MGRGGGGGVCHTYPPGPKVPKVQKSPSPSPWGGGWGWGFLITGDTSMEKRSRRDLLKTGGVAAMTIGLAACASPPPGQAAPTPAVAPSQPAAQPTATDGSAE